MRCLLILAHPRRDSLCGALFDAYAAGARRAGVDCRELVLSELCFDPDVHALSPELQTLESDLVLAQRDIQWAHHIVLVYPTWWGTFPALLKAFLDRVLIPGFAFRHLTHDTWDRLLSGRTADLLTTMDTPALVYRFVYRSPGRQALARATLGYCGVRIATVESFGPVVASSAEQRTAWLDRAGACGKRLVHGSLSPAQRRTERLLAWIAALRLQFYPMTCVSFTVGSLAASVDKPIAWPSYFLGYIALFFLEASTVFLNDWFDLDSDRRNVDHGPFTGGSRVLVDGRLDHATMRKGIVLTVLLAAMVLSALIVVVPAGSAGTIALLYGIFAFLAIGYTVPPLRFSYRGLGELDVALTHSAGAIMAGYLTQAGAWTDSAPWLIALPLGISVLPSILLAGCPDHDADRGAGKRTLVVIAGRRNAVRLALWATLAAPAVAALLWLVRKDMGPLFGCSVLGGTVHAAYLIRRLNGYIVDEMPRRIDGAIVLALAFSLWFCLVPLIALIVHAYPA